jgi:FkbM family methyltransferase
MITNTRFLFKTLLRQCRADCLLDIGSCDGTDSLKFRRLLPTAAIAAFEANPSLFKRMAANPAFRENRIEVFPWAVANRRGTAIFHVTDVDGDAPHAGNPGTSSLLVHEGLKVKEAVEVQTCRVDEFLPAHYPNARRVGLWIDVEGAEFQVIEGISGARDRVVALHVETAYSPMRVGQKVYSELEPLLKSLGFVPVGRNIPKSSIWGDVVFIQEQAKASLGLRLGLVRFVAWLTYWCRAGSILVVLEEKFPALSRLLWRGYTRLFG